MAVILFPDWDAVRLVLASRAVPSALALVPIRWAADDKGRIWCEPSAGIPKAVVTALTRFGAKVLGTSGAALTEVAASWPLMLPLQSGGMSADERAPEAVLFDLPRSQMAPHFVAELRRLGSGKIGVRSSPTAEAVSSSDPRCLLLVERPPIGTLLRALERQPESPRAYERQAPRVWVELGHHHPLADHIAPPAGSVALLAAPHRYEWLPDAPFHLDAVAFELPRESTGAPHSIGMQWELPIVVTLVPCAEDENPELWIYSEERRQQLHDFVRQSSDRVVALLNVASAEFRGQRIAVVAKRSRGAGPVLMFDGAAAYSPVLRLPNLFVPKGMRLRPLPRRDVLRQWLAADADSLVWLSAAADGRFTRHSLPLSAFQPLSESVNYPIAHSIEAIPYVERPAVLPLAPFVVREPAPGPARAARKPPTPSPPKPRAEPPPSEGWLQKLGKWLSPLMSRTEEPAAIPDRLSRQPAVNPPLEAPAAPRHGWDAHRRDLETRLLSNALSDDERRTLWPELAGLYSAMKLPADAAACWLHALWDDDGDAARWARGWLMAEARTANPESEFEKWLTLPTSPDKARPVAAFIVWAVAHETPAASAVPLLARVQQILNELESRLPVRAAWLSRLAIHALSGGDDVGLAQCRDRLLHRLFQDGLSADLDAPSFVRFAGQVTDDRRQQVRDWLLRIREPIHRWLGREATSATGADLRLPQFGLGAPAGANRAYADLIVAWGLARLGERTACEERLADARRELSADDPIHAFLWDAFAWRARQTLEGYSHRGPLSVDLRDRLAQLAEREKLDGARRESQHVYKIERFRQMSRVLEPEERVRAFEEGHLSRATPLRGIAHRDELAARLNELLTRPEAEMATALAVSLDLAPRVGESFAAFALDRLMAVVDQWDFSGEAGLVESQVAALERGWFVAAHFNRAETARHLLDGLMRLLEARRDAPDATHAGEMALLGLLSEALRGLRRLGLRAEADQLLDRLGDWVSPTSTDVSRGALVLRRVSIAGGWFYAGRDLEATSALDDARLVLLGRRLGSRDQSNLASAYVAALGQAPVRIALGRIQEVFEQVHNVTDQLTTNSHFSLSRLRLIETAVLAVANDDFSLGTSVRRWLDDDEFRVRQRIHRDVTRMTDSVTSQ